MKIGILFLLLAVFGLIHQKLFTAGGWFDWSQFLHHESLIVLCLGIGIALIIGSFTIWLIAQRQK